MDNGTLGFMARLKRHHIFRVASIYAVAAWVLIQLGNSIFPNLGWPRQSVLILITAVALLFPVVLVLGWMFIPPSKEDPDKFSQWQHLRWRLGSVLTVVVVALVMVSGVFLWRANARRMQAQALTRTVTPAATAAAPVAAAIPAKSVAVLPFENLSPDKNNAYFASGMQDMILTKLAGIADLKVIARTSTEKYVSHPDDLRVIGQQLGVAAVLEGSVQKSGNQVLINVQLIDAGTDAHLWAEAYQRNLNNIFDVEGEVAGKVATALNARLSESESTRLAVVPTQNPEAYDLFLQGEYYRNRCGAEYQMSACEQAIQEYRAATQKDLQFALAFARMADVQLFQGRLDGGDTSPQLYASAKANVDRALTLAPQLAEAHLAQGFYDDYANGNLDASLRAFEQARALKPQDAETIFAIGINYKHRDQWIAAIQSYRQALALDPRNLEMLAELAFTYEVVGHYADTVRTAKQGLAINPESSVMLGNLIDSTLLQTGDVNRALALLDAAPADGQKDPSILELRANLLYLRRDYTTARNLLVQLPANTDSRVGAIEGIMGDIERAAGNLPAANTHYLHAAALIEAGLKADVSQDAAFELHRDLAYNYAALGRVDKALEQLRLAGKFIPHSDQPLIKVELLDRVAQIQGLLGNAGKAVAALDKLLASGNGGYLESVAMLKLDPLWDPIRGDPRFQVLLQKYSQYKPAVIYDAPPDASSGKPIPSQTSPSRA